MYDIKTLEIDGEFFENPVELAKREKNMMIALKTIQMYETFRKNIFEIGYVKHGELFPNRHRNSGIAK